MATGFMCCRFFVDPPEEAPPDPKDPNVIYFGPGVHEVEAMQVTSGKTVYVAGGAIVYGKPKGPNEPGGPIFELDGSNITLRGRGIIDGSRYAHGHNIVQLHASKVRVEGVIMRDSSTWTFPVWGDHVQVRDIKILVIARTRTASISAMGGRWT